MEVIVKQGQNIFDVAVEHLENALMAYQIARLNGLSITDVIQAGTTLTLPAYTNTYTSEPPIKQQTKDLEITIKQGQTLLDIAVQYCGDAVAAFDIAKLNGLSVSSGLQAGLAIKLIPALNEGIARYFKLGNHVPSTASNIQNQIIEPILSGIGYWAIEQDFIVS